MQRSRAPRGFSLIELLTVLTILAILAMIAAPSLTRTVQMHKVRSTLNRLAVDIYYARALAARKGRTVRIEFAAGDSERCPPVLNYSPVGRYTIRFAGSSTAVKSVSFGDDAAGVCVLSNQLSTGSVRSNGRMSTSLPRTVLAQSGGVSDSLKISFPGRVLRSF